MRLRASVAVALGLAGLAGCGPSVVDKAAADHGGDNLAALSRIYTTAQRKLGRPPRGAEDLKAAAAEYGDLDKLLVSPVDGQRYVVVWGVDLGNAPNPLTVVAYERAGAGGVRYVLTPTGVMKLTENEFARAPFPPGHKPGGP